MNSNAVSRRQFCIAALAALTAGAAFAAPAQAGSWDDVFPNSDIYILTSYDLQGKSAYELYIGRNEIYARHGYIFSTPELARYFSTKSWYYPRYNASAFDERVLSYTEQRNIALIIERERAIGSPYISGSGGGQQSGSYIFPQSSSSYLTDADLRGRSAWELYIARNEIYARHGYGFSRRDLKDYFARQPWYSQRYAPGAFNENELSNLEQANIGLILSYERAMNSPYL